MPKFLIVYDAGFGEEADVIEAEDQRQADDAAYEMWRDIVESNASYRAEPVTAENLQEYDLDPGDYGL